MAIAAETLTKIKELRNVANDTENKLEKDGISITDINKGQLFDQNIKNIISSVEGLLRNEPSERHCLRLEQELPTTYKNIHQLKETSAGRLNAQNLERIKELVGYIEKNFKHM